MVLDQVIVGPRFQGIDRGRLGAGAGDDHHRRVFRLRENIKRRPVAERKIGDDNVEFRRAEQVRRFGNGAGDGQVIGQTLSGHETLKRRLINAVVFDQQDPDVGFHVAPLHALSLLVDTSLFYSHPPCQGGLKGQVKQDA